MSIKGSSTTCQDKKVLFLEKLDPLFGEHNFNKKINNGSREYSTHYVQHQRML